jgi:hypothetical protein
VVVETTMEEEAAVSAVEVEVALGGSAFSANRRLADSNQRTQSFMRLE